MRSGQDLIRSPKLPPAAAIEFAIFFVSTAIPAPGLPFPSTLAGAEGFEPPSPVLETGSLTVELTPLRACHPERDALCLAKDLSAPREHSRVWRASLFHLFVRRMLAAPAAEFLELQPLGRSFP